MNAPAALPTAPRKVKLTVEDYLVLDAGGAFAEYGRTELIEGDVYAMNAQHTRHGRIKTRLLVALAGALDTHPELEALGETTVGIPPHNAPEPDIVVTSAAEGEGLIPLDSVRLVVEVSDSTLKNDLGMKAALYARSGIPEYWVVDAAGAVVHQLWSPGSDGYAERRSVPLGQTVEAATIAGLVVKLPAG